jgi:hypothetical protein
VTLDHLREIALISISQAQRSTTMAYSKDAVDKAIASSNRSGRRIGGKEARLIHALLKGPTYPVKKDA